MPGCHPRPWSLGARTETCPEDCTMGVGGPLALHSPIAQKGHPRSDGGGPVRCQAAPMKAPSSGCPRRTAERAGLSLACGPFLPNGVTMSGGGVPRAQSTKTPSAPRQCPDATLPTGSSLNSAHIWGQSLKPLHSNTDSMRQNRQSFQDACLPGGMNYYRELSAMSSGCHFTCQRLAALPWPGLLGSRALIPAVQGQKLYSLP